MKNEYNNEVDALYIRIQDKEVFRTQEIEEDVNVDLDEKGAMIGLEIIVAVIASLSPLGVGILLKEQFVTYPGNADVLVGMLPDPCATVRDPADEDVNVPRTEVAMCWHIHVLKIFHCVTNIFLRRIADAPVPKFKPSCSLALMCGHLLKSIVYVTKHPPTLTAS